ncbi:MAG: hypothetical protein U0271_27970 [Polyangiaceae bacterium]
MRTLLSTTALSLCLAACGDTGEAGGNGGGPAGGAGGAHGGAGGAGPTPNRTLGLEINQPNPDGHDAAIEKARAAGVGATQLTLPWVVFEPDAGTHDFSLSDFAIPYYADKGLSLLLSIPTVDTVARLVPQDLAAALESGAARWSDGDVIARFAAVLDGALASAGDKLDYLVVGNELDVFFASKTQAEWDEFAVFVGAAVDHVHASHPDILVGVSVTLAGVLDPRLPALTANSDVRFVTYYPSGNLGGQSSGDIAADLDAMLAYAGDKPLVLKECGYATGDALADGEAGQVAFLTDLFAAWDDRAIPLIMLSRMYDGDRTQCEATAAAYGLPGNEAFIQFLCTLGLFHFDESEKPGWSTLEALSQGLRTAGS